MSVGYQNAVTFPTGAIASVPAGIESGQTHHKPPRGATAPLVLVADLGPTTRKAVRQLLEAAGCRVIESSGPREAMTRMSEAVSIVIIDLEADRTSGLECLRYIHEHFSNPQAIAFCGAGKIRDGVAAMKEGACDYVTKPWDPDELLVRIRRATQAARLARENRSLKEAICPPMATGELVGSSAKMQSVRAQIERFAQLDSTVLIAGATGTGKTVAAQLIHRNGPRAMTPFVVVNCADLPRDLIETELFGHVRGAFPRATNDRPGRAELAHGGTLLIDEVGNLPIELQPRLLQFLQERTVRRIGSPSAFRVNVRVIATTHQDLALMGRQRRFNEDLHSRLKILSLYMPTVKEHFADIPELVYEILHRIARRRDGSPMVLSDAAVKALQQHDWPGNMREMEDLLERAVISCTGASIERKDMVLSQYCSCLPPREDGTGLGLAGMTLSKIERCAVIETLKACGGNRVKTARQLGVSEKTIYNKIKQYKLTGTI